MPILKKIVKLPKVNTCWKIRSYLVINNTELWPHHIGGHRWFLFFSKRHYFLVYYFKTQNSMLFRTNISWAFLHTTEALMLEVSGSAGKVTPGFIPHYTNQDLCTVEDFVKYRPEIIGVFFRVVWICHTWYNNFFAYLPHLESACVVQVFWKGQKKSTISHLLLSRFQNKCEIFCKFGSLLSMSKV